MRVMTINVWSDYADNPVAPRETGILNTIKAYSPDIIGMQEFSKNFYTSRLFEELKQEYVCVGIREKTSTPVFFKKSVFTLRECGWVWYDGTMFDDKSITWAVLDDNVSGRRIGICSTHLWYKIGEEHDKIRENNAKQLLDKMTYIKNNYDAVVFAVGDFNCTTDSMAMKYLEENGVYTSYKLTDNHSKFCTYHGYPVKGEDGKFYGKPTNEGYENSIDHIVTFKNDVIVKRQDIVVNEEILGSTDHSPLYADIEIP